MKIGILGFYCAPNYGAVLTSYSLYKELKKLGHEPELVHIPYSVWPNYESCRCLDYFSNVFIQKHCMVSPEPDCEKAVYELNQRYDVFITGSDQLWCSRIYDDSTNFFFLDFVDANKGKISYATSIGERNFTGENCEHKGELLKRFDALSVREEVSVSYLKDAFGIEADCCIDPVFFWDQTDYQELIVGYSFLEEDAYALVHLVGNRERKKQKLKIAEKIARKQNLRIKIIDIGIPVEEYLSLIANSKLIITDSFHGMCFSIIFRKQFLVLSEGRNSQIRFDQMKNIPEITKNIFIHDCDAMDIFATEHLIDYDSLSGKFLKYRKKSETWLREALIKTENKLLAKKTVTYKYYPKKIDLPRLISSDRLSELLRKETDPDRYSELLHLYISQILMIVVSNRKVGNGEQLLSELRRRNILKAAVKENDSYVALIDKNFNFMYENRSSNRISYHYEWPERDGFYIMSEGTALKELQGFCSIVRTSDRETEYLPDKAGIHVAVFDASDMHCLDVCSIGGEELTLSHGDKIKRVWKLPSKERYEIWQFEKNEVRNRYFAIEKKIEIEEKYSLELKELYKRQGRKLIHVSRNPDIVNLKPGKARTNMYGDSEPGSVYASSDEVQQMLYAARCVCGGMRVWGRNRLCLLDRNPFKEIKETSMLLKVPVTAYQMSMEEFMPVVKFDITSAGHSVIRFDDEWFSAGKQVVPVRKKKIEILDPELLKICDIYIPGDNYQEEIIKNLSSSKMSSEQISKKMEQLADEKIVRKLRL